MLRDSRTRALHLIDLENLVGTARDAESVRQAWTAYLRAVPVLPGDAVVVGTAAHFAGTAWFALPEHGIRRVVGANAPDGADLALLAAIDPGRDFQRFDVLVVGSGDHIFGDLAGLAREAGMTVDIVYSDCVSWKLARHGRLHRIPLPTPVTELVPA